MASLRERAIAFLRDDHGTKEPGPSANTVSSRNIVDLAAEARVHRPDTPGAASFLNVGRSGTDAQGKRKGFMGRLKGMVGGKGKVAEPAAIPSAA